MARLPFQPALEGLRGISVLAVLLFHGAGSWLPGGFLGVSTFFTLSGFLITGLLVAEWESTGTLSFAHFWGRRLRRLLPASLVALLLLAVLGETWADPTQRERLSGDGLAALFYVSNWWLILTGADYDSLMGSPSLVQHFWSLSVEEQYYFFYPLLTWAILRSSGGSRFALGGALSVATLLSWSAMAGLASTDVATARIYYGTDTRAGELLAGGVLALLRPGLPARAARTRAWVGWLGIVGVAITAVAWEIAGVESEGLYEGGLAVYTAGTLAVIAAGVQPGGPVRAALSWAPLRWLGRISYGAYVYHWPIFLWVDGLVPRLGITLVAAQLSYRFLEEPIRAGRWILGWRRFAVPPVAIGVVTLALALVGPADVASDPLARMENRPPVPPEQRLRIAVAGDSLARDVGEGLAWWAERSGRAEVENIAIRGCGIARGAWVGDQGRKRAPCDRWPERARKRLAAFRPDVVVVLTAGWDLQARKLPEWDTPRVIGDPDFDGWLVAQYVEAFELFHEAGARVVWMTTPCRRSPMGVTTGSWDPARSRRMNDHVLPTLAEGREDALSVVDLEEVMCPGGEFRSTLHGIENFRRDGTHLSEPGKRWVGAWLGETLIEGMPGSAQRRGTMKHQATVTSKEMRE